MTVGSLFSGIGGFDLGLERAGMTIKWQVEIDDFCNKVLEKHWPRVKRYRDIKELRGDELEPVDLICGGFPCQPFSAAGKRRSKEDDRYLWPEMLRIIRAVRPTWIIGENVAGILSLALDDVLSDLESEGYTCQSFIIPACAVNAPHRRDRIWIVAHTNGKHREESKSWNQLEYSRKEEPFGRSMDESLWQETWLDAASRICGVDDGLSRRLDANKRITALGNAVVPQIVEIIGKAIIQTGQAGV